MRRALGIYALLAASLAAAEVPPIELVSNRLAETKFEEASALHSYTVLRHYVLRTDRQSAEMMVQVTYTNPGDKRFDVLWVRGSGMIEKRVFRKLLEAETEAAHQDLRITPANYNLERERTEMVNGRLCYVLTLQPRSSSKYLLRGRAWVDAKDFAVVRVEGSPASTGSFWVKNTHVVQRYRKVGQFWLPAVNESKADVRFFGEARLTIENLEYQINRGEGETRAEAYPAPARVE